jgi:Tol biopolymer transport system component
MSALGAGGMGEVYKARDTRLDRTVAIKVLPDHLSSSPELKQRLDREARAISQLNHPHICSLYDVGTQDGTAFLVMEFLEGETLAERLTRGTLPLNQTVKIAVDIADALDRAHGAGIVHRDLKPGNIMLTSAGAKLLDFGLAKPTGIAEAGSAIPPVSAAVTTTSPSPAHSPLTTYGTIVGTVQYMSPEQLQGKEADSRSDIFSFGAVLYEMATGRRAFAGKSQLSVASAILESDPEPIGKWLPLAPPALEHIVARCLAKDPMERWQAIRDVRIELEWVPKSMPAGAPRPGTAMKLWASVLGAAGVALVAGIVAARLTSPNLPTTVTRTYVLPPANAAFHFVGNAGEPVMISPDGKALVYGALSDGQTELWVQSLDSLTPERLRGTERAMFPFWSPDGRYVAFFADGKLKKIDVVGGAPETICDAPVGRGGSWSSDGTILFSPTPATGLYRVAAQGGTPVQVTHLDESRGETTHRWPEFLPDGRHFLYLAANPASSETDESNVIYLGSLDSSTQIRIAPARSNPVYADGHILYVHSGTLYALPFDARNFKVTGDPAPVARDVQIDPAFSRATFAASRTGVLVYGLGGSNADVRQLTWFDTTGRKVETLGNPQRIFDIRLSPDGRKLAMSVDTGRLDLWLFDLDRQTITPFTRGTGEHFPVWSPDGKQIAYNTDKEGVLIAAADGSGSAHLISSDKSLHVTDWSRDGKYLLITRVTQKLEIWAISLEGDRRPFPVVVNETNNTDASFSPDGNWIVYDSPQSGRSEVYITRFHAPGPRYQVSAAGGDLPRWGRDGRTVFFLDPIRLEFMAAETRIDHDSLIVGRPRTLFSPKPSISYLSADYSYDIAPDGNRFLLLTGVEEQPTRAAIVTNWTADLKK